MQKITDNAQIAYEYASGKGKDAENFKKCIASVKLIVFSKIMIFSFDEDEGKFLPFFLVIKSKPELIARELEDEVMSVMNLQKKIKTSKWLHGSKKKEMSEIQDLGDAILKMCYTYISEGKGWTEPLSLHTKGTNVTLTVMPWYVPMGVEDKVTVCVGMFPDEFGKMKLAKIDIWRDEQNVYLAWLNYEGFKVLNIEDLKDEINCSFDPLKPTQTSATGNINFLGRVNKLGNLY